MNKKALFSLAAGIILAGKAFAIDPIAWTLDQAFPPEVTAAGGGTWNVTYTLQSQLDFPMGKPLLIIKKASSNEFTFDDRCSGKKLQPQERCQVQITLAPVSPGVKSVQIITSLYDKNQVPLPELLTKAIENTGVRIAAAVTRALPVTMEVESSANYEFQFTNTGTAEASNVSVHADASGFSTTCTSTLAAGASCKGSGIFTPVTTTPSTQEVRATLNFAQGSPVSVATSTIVTEESGLVGDIIQGLPNATVLNINYPVHFQFTNKTADPVNINQNNSFPPQLTGIVNTCPDNGASLNALASCEISGVFNAVIPGPYTIIAQLVPTVMPPATATLATETQTVSNTGHGRTIHFENYCNFPVWFSLNGGNRQNNGANIPCTSDNDCPTGSQCNPSANGNTGLCFWANYGPSDNNFKLDASGGGHFSNGVFIPDPGNLNDGIFWSGAFSASTDCSGTDCEVAYCQNGAGTKSCAPGTGFNQPATQAEITMQIATVDSYDVEVINGFHLPIQIAPDGQTANGYSCGSPGDPVAQNGFGACNWNTAVTPAPNYPYIWVTSGGGGCESGCPGQICGLDNGLNQVCGNFLGFWTANEACARDTVKAHNYFNCMLSLSSPFEGYQLSALYACSTPNASQSLLNSCYLNGAQNNCCGCANWQNLGITLPPTATCNNTASTWNSQVEYRLLWMKKACPNYYTYPFDDKSSSFTCSNGNPNTQSYTVTFCPGGYTGLPNGAPEGR